MTIDQITDLANTQAESKGSTLDLRTMFLHRLQEFCREARFHWRRKTTTFTTTAGTADYDLSSTTLLPTSTDAADMEQIISVSYLASATDVRPLHPVFDIETIEYWLSDLTQDVPSYYFIKPGTDVTLRLAKVPGGAYSIRVTYWAIPATVENASTVPLVPARHHDALVKGLKMDIWENAFGEGSSKFQSAQASYQRAVQQAIEKNTWSTRRELRLRSVDRSIRSTR